MILLDTCTLLWLASDQKQLSLTVKKSITKHKDALFVSAITAFEIALKARQGKLELPMKASRWYEETVEFHNIVEIPVDGWIAGCSAKLPQHHNDPCDRIIVATAIAHSLTLLTPDKHIKKYKKVKTVW